MTKDYFVTHRNISHYLPTIYSKPIVFLACILMMNSAAIAGGTQAPEKSLGNIEITAKAEDKLGISDSATQGTVTARQLENRPILRPGEVLETVPGLIITQHTGDGKANQYFLRGFNLDHGTDFRTSVLGMPLNMPTHAHGQGYNDLNFLIPELVRTLQYKKGPYYAEEGDFSSAGAVAIDYFSSLPKGIASLTLGPDRYARGLLANSTELGPGQLLYAVETSKQDGPWTVPEDFKKFNSVLRYSFGQGADKFSVNFLGYQARWISTDHVPAAAINDGTIDRYGSLDPTSGGKTHRYSLSADWKRQTEQYAVKSNIYYVDYELNLFSNFTYFANDPINGDQFRQLDRRKTAGLNSEYTRYGKWNDREWELSAGLQYRTDRLSPVGLYTTANRDELGITRQDRISESSVGVFAKAATRWTPWFRTILGLRTDRFDANVNNLTQNLATPVTDGSATANQTSPKIALIFGPFNKTEFFINAGKGFHSNDARGAVDRNNPAPFIVGQYGSELGMRTVLIPGLQTSLAFWQLRSKSELVFAGDAGTTEATGGTRRYGVELSNYYAPTENLVVDADIALTRARYIDDADAGSSNTGPGKFIPGALDKTVSLGATYREGRWSSGLRVRYFGAAPLVEDGSVKSRPSLTTSVLAAYQLLKDVRLSAEVINLFDRKNDDIAYYYDSTYKGRNGNLISGPGLHVHPAEPRTFRVGVSYSF